MSDPLEAALAWAAHMQTFIERQQELEAIEEAHLTVAVAPLYVDESDYPTDSQWEALRQCESGGNYRADTGNGYYGAYQFAPSTWASYGPAGNPAQASPEEQDRRAQLLFEASGWDPWPVCGDVAARS